MWFAYHMAVLVPAKSTVSCSEKPTLSLASTRRRLRQVGASTSRSVPPGPRSRPVGGDERIRRAGAPAMGKGLRRLRGLQFAGRGDRLFEDLQSFGQLMLRDGERGQQLDHFA